MAKRCEDFVATTADMPGIASDAYIVRGLLALAQGDWGEAASWLSQRGTSGTESLPVPLAATAAGALIRLALARQELEAAAEQARAAWAVVAGKGVWSWAAELAPWAVEALTRAGESATAHAMVQDFARGLDRGDAPAAMAALTWSRAVLAETGAPAREGRDGLLRAAELYREAAAAYARLAGVLGVPGGAGAQQAGPAEGEGAGTEAAQHGPSAGRGRRVRGKDGRGHGHLRVRTG
ncbi:MULTISPECIES: hypothetical protein [unclassified Streptomyces]|uniref:hypothetical protein n=1 Tax=unclassified Streptomyces TaxID=2593676 RepID=UPI00081B1840|nr:hypothetical protein GA0115247_113718 [Streptomyces sp. PalvLS-984]SDD71388.1 hypothetical protein F558DRAFT_04682 [Streptomyces sp. AmelKG-A3]